METLRRLNNRAYDIEEITQGVDKVERLAGDWLATAALPEIAARRLQDERPETLADLASMLEEGTGKKLLDEIRQHFDEFISEEKRLMADRYTAAADSSSGTMYTTICLAVLSLGLGVILTISTTRSITKPVHQLSAAARRVAQGDLTQEVDGGTGAEMQTLAASFRDLQSGLRDAGDLQVAQDWLRNGQAQLADAIRGDQDVAALTSSILTFLVRYMDSHLGAFYTVAGEDESGDIDDIDNRITLHLAATYAIASREHIATEIQIGDGLIGQVALEKQYLVLTEVPDDYLAINSALGDVLPTNILVWPVVHDGMLKGVIEIGSLDTVTDAMIELLSLSNDTIAIAIDVAASRVRLQKLLNASQVQSEELQLSNQNLAQQSARLQASEESLQAQSEDLQQTNEELEEKTESLQRQRKDLLITRLTLEKQAEELKLSSKYKSVFLANMSHELRTPLNSMLILAKVLATNDEDNFTADQIEAANVIHDSGQNLLTLINEILDLAKVESGMMEAQLEPVRLQDLVHDLGSQFKLLAEVKQLTVELHLTDDLPETLLTDRQEVEQVIRNLFSNALKFTPSGSVSLRVPRVHDNTQFRRSDLTPEGAIAFSIIDTGIGIPEDKQKLIFESFQQADGSTSRNYGGTGLGLTISREFARLLGGEILLESVEGEGSTFTLCLPLNPKLKSESTPVTVASQPPQVPASSDHVESAPDASQSHVAAEPMRPDRSILIVEDDRSFANVLGDLCRRKGFRCLSAGTGVDALQMIAEHKPNAVLLDLNLPDLDGMTVLNELKNNLATRHIPVHIISGNERGNAALVQGALGFLSKPISTDDLVQAIDSIEQVLNSTIKHLLIIEDDGAQQDLIADSIKIKGVEITEAASGAEGLGLLQSGTFDCLIIDEGLRDLSGFELLTMLEEEAVATPPVIMLTSQDVSANERQTLEKSGVSIVVKEQAAAGLLVDKVSLFLHSVESSLPESQRREIRMLHNCSEQLQGQRILVVDDDMRNVFALSAVLQRKGLKVSVAENGRLALDLLEQEEVDLIIMDVMMPVMDGYEAMCRIRQDQRLADVPIIALTANAMPEDRAKCLEAGASDYLTKPVDVDRLLSLIRVWIFKQ